MKIAIHKNSRSGIALIIVMLVILVLAVAAGEFATSMKVEATLARNANYESQMEWLGRSGVDLAGYFITEQSKIPGEGNYESLNQKWAGGPGGIGTTNSPLSELSLKDVQLGGGTISVTITDLERKFNINMANQDVLQQAMVVLMGVDPSVYQSIGDSILDWIDKDEDPHLSGAESDYYMGLDPPYMAKNGPMDDISELLLVKGIFENPAIYWGSASTNHPISAFQVQDRNRPFDDLHTPSYPVGLVDIFSTLSSGKININTASVTTLQMIPNVDENFAMGIVQLRSGPDGVDGTEDDIPFQNASELINVPGSNHQLVAEIAKYCGVRSSTFEVQVDANLGGLTRQYFAVIRRGARQGDFAILKFYWK